jgi:dihydroorotase
MAEILTLAEAGAASFSSVFPITNARFMTNLLLYMQHAEAVLIHSSWDPVLATGQVHEGFVSHNRGLEGIPSLAEEIMVERDISILHYTGGKLHIPCISAAGSVTKLVEGKKQLPGLSFSVAAHQLLFTDDELDSFQTVHKVFPPYRLETDRQALIEAVKSGDVDAIVSDHTPLHSDFKVIEFGNASFGISSLETTYSALMTAIPDLSPENQVNLLANGPRKILGLETMRLEPGALADITIFSPDKEWIPGQESWQSRSHNSPFFGSSLKGVVKGVITSTGYYPNPHLAESHS